MSAIDEGGIEVILFAHSQGNFLGGSITSILRAAAYAEARGIKVDLRAILYSPTPLTRAVAKEFLDHRWQVTDLETATLDQARNEARTTLKRSFAALIDGDDLWCETWLHAAYEAASVTRAVWRPEVLLTFGNDFHRSEGYSAIFQPFHLSNPAALLLANPLPSGFFVAREILVDHPWPAMDKDCGLNAGDQQWNCDVAAGGYEHRAIPSTFHYRRLRDALLGSRHERASSSENRIGQTRLASMHISHLPYAGRGGIDGI